MSDFIRSSFSRAAKTELAMKGVPVTFRRLPSTDIVAIAMVSGQQSEELVNGIVQSVRKIIARAEDLSAFSPALRRGDKALHGTRTLHIEDVDAATMAVAGLLIIKASG